jgi:hypothetical protein
MTIRILKRFTIGPAFSPIKPVEIFAFHPLEAHDEAKRIFPGLGPLKTSLVLDWPAEQ